MFGTLVIRVEGNPQDPEARYIAYRTNGPRIFTFRGENFNESRENASRFSTDLSDPNFEGINPQLFEGNYTNFELQEEFIVENNAAAFGEAEAIGVTAAEGNDLFSVLEEVGEFYVTNIGVPPV